MSAGDGGRQGLGDQELRVKFHRIPETVCVLGGRLDQGRARALARLARDSRTRAKAFKDLLRTLGDRGEPILVNEKMAQDLGIPQGKLVNVNATAIREELKCLTDPTHRQPRDQALWVAVLPSERQHFPLPSLQDIAALSQGSLDEWAEFVAHYGLLEFDRTWVVTWLGEESLLRVPLDALKETAYKAAVLVAATKAALGFPEEFEEWGPFAVAVFRGTLERRSLRRPARWEINVRVKTVERPDPYEYARRFEEARLADPAAEARKIIALALEDALEQMGADVEPADHGIPSKWALYARGCWPLVVQEEFVQKDRRVRYKSVFCVAPGCSNPVPDDRGTYCCNRCLERAKKQRQRAKSRATNPASIEPPKA